MLIEVWHIINRDKGVRFVFEFFGNHLELHKHLAPSGAIGLDNPHGASRRVAFNLMGVLQQHRGLPKPVGRIKNHDAGLSALGEKLIHQAFASHHIASAQRHQLEVVYTAQIVYHARSSTRPYGHCNRKTIQAAL